MTILDLPPRTAPVTIADLLSRLGDIPPSRIRLHPFPGTATQRDVVSIHDHENVTCELVEGTLVAKPMGLRESLLAMILAHYLNTFIEANDLGFLSGEAGTMNLFGDLVRAPDLAFISFQRLPGSEVRDKAIPRVVPDLAIEILSDGNTAAEMQRKLEEYFAAGVRLVWIIDHRTRSAAVYTSVNQVTRLADSESLEGGDVLPGFTLSLKQLFDRLERAFNAGSARP